MARFSSSAQVFAYAESSLRPLSALFELTGRCNLDCKHCYLDIAHPPDEMSTAECKGVIDQLADAGTLFLTLTGGEIFLRKDAIEIAEHARSKGMALRIFTNATRIDRELAAEIARIRPMAVEVSLYAAHGEVQAKVTQRRWSLRRTLRGVALLRKHGVTVGLKAPLLYLSVGEVDAVIALADRLGCRVKFDPVVDARRDGMLSPTELRVPIQDLAIVLRHPRLKALASGLPEPIDPRQSPCMIARGATRIAPNGDVFPCPSYPVAAGNVRRQSFPEIWARAPLLEHLRALTFGNVHGDCKDCSQSGYCNRCMAQALIEQGDELGPDREACRLAEAKEIAMGVPLRNPGRHGSIRHRLRVVS